MSIPADQVPSLIERIIRIDEKLTAYLHTTTDHESRLRALESDNTPGGHSDHESRIRRLERAVWVAAGAGAAAGGVLGSILKGIT